jgi:hypothetical protein
LGFDVLDLFPRRVGVFDGDGLRRPAFQVDAAGADGHGVEIGAAGRVVVQRGAELPGG